MGDRSLKSLVNLGDVVLIDTGDGVFTRREPHTSNQLTASNISSIKIVDGILIRTAANGIALALTLIVVFIGVAMKRKML